MNIKLLAALIILFCFWCNLLNFMTGCNRGLTVANTTENPAYFEFRATMPTARCNLASTVLNGKIYAISGFDDTLLYGKYSRLRTVEVYTPATDSWEKKSNTLHGSDFSGAVTAKGKIYHIGGGHNYWYFENNNEYNSNTDTWTAKEPLPVGLTTAAFVTNGEKIFVIGGYYFSGGDVWLSSLYIYDPKSDTWTQGPDMHYAYIPTATIVEDKIYVLSPRYFEVYDISNNSWTIKDYPPFTYDYNCDYLRTLKGRVYNIDAWNNEIYLYKPEVDTWAKLGIDIPVKIDKYAVSAVEDSFYIMGGRDDTNHFHSYNIKFNPPLENQPPDLEIMYPYNDALVKDMITISGAAIDRDGVIQRVELRIDENPWVTVDGNTTWGYRWDTTNYTNGVHIISVRSFDGEFYSPIENISVVANNQPPEIPDLYIDDTDISFSKRNPSVGENITIYGVVHNWGEMNATATITFYEGNPYIAENPTEMIIESKIITVPPQNNVMISVTWAAQYNGSHQIYALVTNCQPGEKTELNNRAYNVLTVGDINNLPLVITLGISNIAPFEGGEERTIPITIYCYYNPVSNISLKILENDNLSISILTPYIHLNPNEKADVLIKIRAPELGENVTTEYKTILVQAAGDNDVTSNVEQISILVHKQGGGIPFSTEAALLASAGGTGILAALYFGFTETGKYKLFAFLSLAVPLLVRIGKEEVLDQFVRGRIFGYIEANPGTHYTDIMNNLEVKNGTLSYHLYILEKSGLIESRREHLRFRAFYSTGTKFPEKENYRLTELQIAILQITKEQEGITQQEIATRLNEGKQKINYNIKVLQGIGKIRIRKKGRETYCYSSKENFRDTP